jgi:hypothetical protein
MNQMKVAIVLGRGIEGCGVTKFTVEQTKWLKKNGYDFSVYSSKDKSWTRKNAHDVSNVVQLKFAKPEETQKMIAGCNAADVVIINSLPSVSHSEECIAQFKRFLNEVTKPVVLVQHDHSSLSIKRNAALDESIRKASVLFGHSPNNDFSRYVSNLEGNSGLSNFFDEEVSTKKVLNFQPGLDFDSIRDKYWLSIDQTRPMEHKWIGRTTSWKGYQQMFKFHNNFLRPAGYITTFEGIEKSPAYLGFRELSEFHGYIDRDINTIALEKDQPAYVFGPYINEQMLYRMSATGFGYQLSVLDERFIERSIEYTHCELACAGVVPVFRKSYGERVTHRATGNKMIDDKNTGIVWLDDNDMQPAFDEIHKLANDPVKRDSTREMAFEYLKSHQDSRYTFQEMMNKIKECL